MNNADGIGWNGDAGQWNSVVPSLPSGNVNASTASWNGDAGTWAIVPPGSDAPATASVLGDVKGCTGASCIASPGLTCAAGYYVQGFASDGTMQCILDAVLQAGTPGDVKGCTGASCTASPGLTCASGYSVTGYASDGTMQCTSVTGNMASNLVAIANGGTNASTTPTAGGIAYGTGTAIGYSLNGTTGYVLQATSGGAPTWVQKLPIVNGGTGASAATQWGVVYASATTTYATTAAGGGTGYLLQANSGAAPTWAQYALVGNGGMGASMTPAGAGEIPYSSSASAYGHLAAGSSGQVLTSGGVGAPTWQTHIYRVAGSNVTSTSTTPANITGLSWSGTSATPYMFHCVIASTGTATGSPIFTVASTGTTFSAQMVTSNYTTTTGTNTLQLSASAGANSVGCTTSCITTTATTIIDGMIVPSASVTLSIQMGNATSGQTATALIGSTCEVW